MEHSSQLPCAVHLAQQPEEGHEGKQLGVTGPLEILIKDMRTNQELQDLQMKCPVQRRGASSKVDEPPFYAPYPQFCHRLATATAPQRSHFAGGRLLEAQMHVGGDNEKSTQTLETLGMIRGSPLPKEAFLLVSTESFEKLQRRHNGARSLPDGKVWAPKCHTRHCAAIAVPTPAA